MGRLFLCVLLLLMLLPVQKEEAALQPVFFSMLFPQLIPEAMLEATEEAFFL